MPDEYVTRRDGKSTASKYLRDLNGNYIYDPKTNQPYKVPENFDLKDFIEKYQAIGSNLNPDISEPERRGLIYGFFVRNFWKDGPDDIQRDYNGLHAQGGSGFVEDFTPTASLLVGIAARQAGITDIEALIGAGVHNTISSLNSKKPLDNSGVFGNAKVNETNIRMGYSLDLSPTYNYAPKTPPFSPENYVPGPNSQHAYTKVTGPDAGQAREDHQYVVKSGNILEDIAKTFGTTPEDLQELNPDIKDKNTIYAGQVIVLPNPENPDIRQMNSKTASAMEIPPNNEIDMTAEDNCTDEDYDYSFSPSP